LRGFIGIDVLPFATRALIVALLAFTKYASRYIHLQDELLANARN
jgi:hypothetical protein